MDSGKLSELLNNVAILQSEAVSEKLSAMTDVSIFLSTLNSEQILSYDKAVPFDLLFQHLTSDDDDDTHRKLCKATCDVLHTFLNAVEPELLFNKYENELLTGLKHPNGEVKELCCAQLNRVWNADKSLLLNGPYILESLIDCTCDESESSGRTPTASRQLLVLIGKTEVGGQAMFAATGSVLNHLKNCLTRHSSTVWFRLMEVVTECCTHISNILRLCIANGLLDQFIAKVKDTSDILSQSVAIEMLESLARTEEGYEWLLAQDVITDLVAMLDDEGNPLAAIAQPAVLKFFGAVTLKYPHKVLEHNDKYFDKLTAIVVDTREDNPLLVNALDSLTATVSTDHGKRILHRTGPKFHSCLHRIGRLMKEASTEVRQVALCCMVKLMSCDVSSDHHSDVSAICERWYQQLDSQPLGTLLTISKAPFVEPRLGALQVYLSLSDHVWAQKMMRDHPTFIEFLIDRSTENEKEGHHLKYNIISNLAQSSTASQVFPAPTLMKLRVYVREGAFYAKAQSQVATEEG